MHPISRVNTQLPMPPTATVASKPHFSREGKCLFCNSHTFVGVWICCSDPSPLMQVKLSSPGGGHYPDAFLPIALEHICGSKLTCPNWVPQGTSVPSGLHPVGPSPSSFDKEI